MNVIFNDDYYMGLALKEAEIAYQEDEVPIGAIIICNGKIIAKAHNMTQQLKDVTAHAEILAITAASTWLGGKYLNDCTLYVTVEPCPMCAGALNWAQLGKLVYGTEDTKRGYTTLNPKLVHPKTEVIYGIREKECSDLIKQYFKSKRLNHIE